MHNFSDDELTWDTMARRELEGLSNIEPGVPAPSGTGEADEGEKKSKNSRLKQRIR
jgi:hypothetical protein